MSAPAIGVSLFNYPAEQMLALGTRADQLGFGSVWIADHVFTPNHLDSVHPYPAQGRHFQYDQVGRLGKHQRRDDVVQGFVDDRLDLLDVPAGAHVGQVNAHPLHLVVVGAGEQEQELGVARFEDGPTVDQTLREEGFAERQRAGFGDDRLVEIEEGGRARSRTGGRRRSLLVSGRVGDGHRPSIGRCAGKSRRCRQKRWSGAVLTIATV